MAEQMKTTKILRGIVEITEYFGFSSAELEQLRTMGLPLVKIGRTIYCHVDVAENWFAQMVIQLHNKTGPGLNEPD